MQIFTAIPFFRILLPFAFGILFAFCLEHAQVTWGVIISLCLLPIILSFSQKDLHYYKIILLLICDLFLFALAVNLVRFTEISKRKNYYGNVVQTDAINYFACSVDDIPVEKEKWIKCRLSIQEIKAPEGYKETEGSVIAYFKKNDNSQHPKVGETLLIKAKLNEIQNPKNPFEFNYRNYLSNKQVYHSVFVDSKSYVKIPNERRQNTLNVIGLRCKNFVIQRINNSQLSQRAYAICVALLTGFDDDIEQSVIDAFAHSGTLHVLSVSGLHVGLIYLAINFLFNMWDSNKKYKVLRFVIITVILWFFAFITGFSAPVLRAVIMFNFFGVGKIWFRSDYRNQMNILALSAFILLTFNPFFITDVGFLLSYFALAGLIYFQPRIYAVWQPKYLVNRYIWQSVTASLAATIATLPITLFYFKQFPIWFFLSNILVVPLSFVVLIFALPLIVKINLFSGLVNYLVTFLVSFIDFIDSGNFGYVDNIHFTRLDALFLSLIIISVSRVLESRSYKAATFLLVTLITWQLVSIRESYIAKNVSHLSVYSVKNENVMAFKNKTQITLSSFNAKTFNFHVKPHFISHSYVDTVVHEFNYIGGFDEGILILNKPHLWPKLDTLTVTRIVLANGFHLNEVNLQGFNDLKEIIIDASNNNYQAKRTEELCRKFGVYFYNVKNSGARVIDLP